MYCPYCGKQLKDSAKFCGYCGKSVKPKKIEDDISPVQVSVHEDKPNGNQNAVKRGHIFEDKGAESKEKTTGEAAGENKKGSGFKTVNKSDNNVKRKTFPKAAVITAAAAAAAVVLVLIFKIAVPSSGNSDVIDNLSGEIKSYEGGDIVYIPAAEDMAYDEEEDIIYYDNLVTVYLNRKLKSRAANKLAQSVGGSVAGQISGAVNVLQIVVESSDLDGLNEIAQKLMESEYVIYAAYDYPLFIEKDTASEADEVNEELKAAAYPDILNYYSAFAFRSMTASGSADSNPWSADGTESDRGNEADPGGNDWWAEAIGAYTAWSLTDPLELSSVSIGIIDTGVDTDHEDLEGSISLLEGYGVNSEEDDHGTQVAGIITANNNITGLRGVADSARLVSADWSPVSGVSYLSTGEYIEMIKLMVESGVKVINNSYGIEISSMDEFSKEEYSFSQKIQSLLGIIDITSDYEEYLKWCEAVSEESARMCMVLVYQLLLSGYDDFLIVQGAGNGYDNSGPGFDASEYGGFFCAVDADLFKRTFLISDYTYSDIKDHIIIVGAVSNELSEDGSYNMTYFSNYGDTIDICAPGEDIFSTCTDDSYGSDGGTSLAGPMVAGAAGLLWQIEDILTAAQVKDLLITYSQSAGGIEDASGEIYPMLDIGEAVYRLLYAAYSGMVTDTDGNPLEGITVAALDENGDVLSSDVTSEEGTYCIFANRSEIRYIAVMENGTEQAKIEVPDQYLEYDAAAAKNPSDDGYAPHEMEDLEAESGGSGITWSYDEDTHTLTISGSGNIPDYESYYDTPWCLLWTENIIVEDGITGIGTYAFSDYDVISIDLADSVEYIGDYAFYLCNDLTVENITIPENCEVGYQAFYCSALEPDEDGFVILGNSLLWYEGDEEDIIIPDTVTYISGITDGGYYAADDVVSITIPESVTGIEELALLGYSSLAAIYVDSKNEYYSSRDGALYSKDGKTLIKLPFNYDGNSYTESDGVADIGDYEFTVPDGVAAIEDYAIAGNGYSKITIGADVADIGEDAFAGFGGTLYLDGENENFVMQDGVLFSSDMSVLIWGGNVEGSYTVPGTVASISDYAFEGCIYLTDITLPDSLISIGDYAFCYCWELTTVTVPDSVTYIGSYAFSGCEELESVTLSCNLTAIETGTFLGCDDLWGIIIPEGVVSIGMRAFYDCDKLISVEIPDTLEYIGHEAFSFCRYLSEISLPKSLAGIGSCAFGYSHLDDIYYAGTEADWSEIDIHQYFNAYLYDESDVVIHYSSS